MSTKQKLYLNNEEYYNTGDGRLNLAAAIVRCALQDIEQTLDIYLKNKNQKNLSRLKGEVRVATTPFMDNYLIGKERVIDIIPGYLKNCIIQKGEQKYKKYNQAHIELVLKLAK